MNKKQRNCVYQIFYHVILTVKYRKKIINQYDLDIKEIIDKLSRNSNFNVEKIESDKDHIHILVSTTPKMSASRLISLIKQKTTYELWKKYPDKLKYQFYKHHTFWSPSYFVNTIGSVSKEAIEKYISNQRNSSSTLKWC